MKSSKDVADMFWDVIGKMDIESFIDVGTGPNGVVGMYELEQKEREQKQRQGEKGIIRKFAIDIYNIKPLPPDWTTIIMDGKDILKRFGEKSIDVIQGCDFIEHITKEEGIRWIFDCEKIARKAILIFTPIGEVHNPAIDLYPNNPWQNHQCGWKYEEFEKLGFETGKDDMHNMWRNSNIIAWKVLAN
jgi:hypothetical protein